MLGFEWNIAWCVYDGTSLRSAQAREGPREGARREGRAAAGPAGATLERTPSERMRAYDEQEDLLRQALGGGGGGRKQPPPPPYPLSLWP